MKSNLSAKAIWEMDKNHFIHPYTDFSTFKDEGSQIISRAKGVHVFDADDKKYLDGIAGLWCVNIGHGNVEMADAIRDQVLEMDYYNPFGHSTNEPAAILAAKLAQLAPSNLNHVFYSTGGSTANDTAIRMAHFYFELRGMPQKKKVISRVDGYHGSTYFAANLTGIHATKIGFNRIAQDMIHHVSAANAYRAPEDMDESAHCDYLVKEFEDRIHQLGADNVAAFIAEPLMGAGGVLVAPENYHRRMHDVCKANDILYVADEVVTAFGRLGEWFASETLYDYQPDILVCAKGITSGYIPLGATLLSDKVYEVISKPQSEGGALTLGFTYSGHAVACAAALKNIEIIEREAIRENVRQVGANVPQILSGLFDNEIVGDIRGSGFMIGIECVQDKETKMGFDSSVNIAHRIFQKCLERGLIIRPIGSMLVLSPPLTFSSDHWEQVKTTLDESVKEVTGEIKKLGLMR